MSTLQFWCRRTDHRRNRNLPECSRAIAPCRALPLKCRSWYAAAQNLRQSAHDADCFEFVFGSPELATRLTEDGIVVAWARAFRSSFRHLTESSLGLFISPSISHPEHFSPSETCLCAPARRTLRRLLKNASGSAEPELCISSRLIVASIPGLAELGIGASDTICSSLFGGPWSSRVRPARRYSDR